MQVGLKKRNQPEEATIYDKLNSMRTYQRKSETQPKRKVREKRLVLEEENGESDSSELPEQNDFGVYEIEPQPKIEASGITYDVLNERQQEKRAF